MFEVGERAEMEYNRKHSFLLFVYPELTYMFNGLVLDTLKIKFFFHKETVLAKLIFYSLLTQFILHYLLIVIFPCFLT